MQTAHALTVFNRLLRQIRKPCCWCAPSCMTARWSNKIYKQTNINNNLNLQAVAEMSQWYWLCNQALCLLHLCSVGQLLRHEIIVTGCSTGICVTMICRCTLHVLHRWSTMLSRSILEKSCLNLVRFCSAARLNLKTNKQNKTKQTNQWEGKGRW